MADNKSTWTVTIVVIHDGVHDHVYDETGQSILQQQLTGGIRYVIFYYLLQEGIVQVKELIFHNNFQRLELVETCSGSIYDTDFLTRLLRKHAGTHSHIYPNKRHLLILNGHGAGLGFFAERTADNGIRMLDASQLARSIRWGINKADVLIAVSCYTQLLETGYMLKEVTDLMIAPQTTMMFYGIGYAKLFALLETNPSASLDEIAKNVTGNFMAKYQEASFRGQWLDRYEDEQEPGLVSLSANYLKAYDAVIECLNQLVHHLWQCFQPGGEELRNAVKRARRNCGELTPSKSFGFIDLTYFLQQLLKEAGPSPFLQEIVHRFGLVRERCMASLHLASGPPDLYTPVRRRGVASASSPLFLSVFFPAFSTTPDQMAIRELYFAENGPFERFRQDCQWGLFIREFFNYT